MKNRSLKRILAVINLIALVMLIGLVLYVSRNESGHTAGYPYALLVIFIPQIFIGCYSLLRQSQMYDNDRSIALFSIAIGLVGLFYLIYIDKTNTLLNYSVWLKRCMPDKGVY